MIEMPNPGEEGYRTAHKQNKDGSYSVEVMPSDIFVESHILLEKNQVKTG